jgi:beta-glucosidase
VATEIAARSIVLLKNEGALPLTDVRKKILVTGHAAHSRRVINGAWTFEWLGAIEEKQPADMPTLYQALEKEFGNDRVNFFPFMDEAFDPVAFQASASRADIILVTAGEYPYSEFKGNISDLALPESQQKMIRAAIESGKPVVLLLIEGRPRLIHEFADKVNSIVFAGLPGSGGPEAISGIVSGRINPSGKLAFTYPSHPGHLVPYNHKLSDRYTYEFPFGHGLSYTEFNYQRIIASDTVISPSTEFTIDIEVTNTGERAGYETVILYMSDEVGSITRPVKKLIGFRTVFLQPGASETVRFFLDPESCLSYPDSNGKWILESGNFTFSCRDLEQRIALH